MSEPAITIITATTTSAAEMLYEAHASLASQTEQNWNWIISEDAPTTAAKALADSDPRITWFNSATHNGPAAARNLAAAQGPLSPIIRNLDADDSLARDDVLEELVDLFDSRIDIDFVVGPVLDVFIDDSTMDIPLSVIPGDLNIDSLVKAWEADPRRIPVHPTSLAVRSTRFFELGGYSGIPLSEDTSLLMRLSASGVGVMLDKPVTRYRKHEAQMTAQPVNNRTEDRARRRKFVELVTAALRD